MIKYYKRCTIKIEKVFLTEENLLKIEKIDRKFYINAIPNIQSYFNIYKCYHSAYLLVNNEDMVVGYIVLVPIKKELYDAIINGVILNDIDINPKMFIEKSDYNYLVSCLIEEKYRNKGYGKKLMDIAIKDIKGNIFCLAITKEGFALASKYHELKEKLNENVSIFLKQNN